MDWIMIKFIHETDCLTRTMLNQLGFTNITSLQQTKVLQNKRNLNNLNQQLNREAKHIIMNLLIDTYDSTISRLIIVFGAQQ